MLRGYTLNIHGVEEVTIKDKKSSDGTKWTTFLFKDKDGNKFDITAFSDDGHPSVIREL